MKNYLIISLLFLSVGFCQQEYNHNDFIEMHNGLWTVKFSDEPITGKVYSYFGESKPYKKVYMGNLRKGKREGKWVYYYQSTGKKKYEYFFKDGRQDGLFTKWYKSGKKMEEAGLLSLEDINKLSVMGFVEVIKHLSFFKTLIDRLLNEIKLIQPIQIILIDYPGFNLRLAKKHHRVSLGSVAWHASIGRCLPD